MKWKHQKQKLKFELIIKEYKLEINYTYNIWIEIKINLF